MKGTKKLIPALALLLVSVLVLSTASFAWFSMNTQVAATGMQVTAKSDNTYLLISSTNTTATAIQTENATTTDLEVAADKLYPSAPAISDAEVAYLSVAAGHYTTEGNLITTAGEKAIGVDKANSPANWYTANAVASNAATIDATTAKQLTTFTGYVVKETVTLTVAAGANGAKDLTVTPNFTQKGAGSDIAAAKILVTTSAGGFIILDSTMNGTPLDIKGDNTALTSTTTLTVNLYIYYDGNKAPVYTNNAANLTGAAMTLTFNVTPVAAA